MKMGVKEFKKEYKKVNIDQIEVRFVNNYNIFLACLWNGGLLQLKFGIGVTSASVFIFHCGHDNMAGFLCILLKFILHVQCK